jgi:large subunit ribosomal protein L17
MRHGKKVNHLGRKKAHRDALLKNMSIALIAHKRIRTTLAKAKALRRYIEPLLTKAKTNTTHSRRVVFSYLQHKETINILFGEIAAKIATRPGGYTRVLRAGFRPSDSAEVAYIELVDFNEAALEAQTAKRRRTRRSRSKKEETTTTTTATTTETPAADTTSNDTPAE